MTTRRLPHLGASFLILAGPMVLTGQAQTTPRINWGIGPPAYSSFSPGYPPASYYNRVRGYAGSPRGAQTVTDFRPLIRAITSLPGWNGAPTAPHRPVRSRPSVPVGELLADDGTIRWPDAVKNETRMTPAKREAEEAVRLVAREHATYGQSTIPHVTDARNKLTELARQWLPSLNSRDRLAAAQLERFIVELQKTLATMTAHF